MADRDGLQEGDREPYAVSVIIIMMIIMIFDDDDYFPYNHASMQQ